MEPFEEKKNVKNSVEGGMKQIFYLSSSNWKYVCPTVLMYSW
jgi:hypothetical protein